MLSVAEATREVFAIGLTDARAGTRAVIYGERIAEPLTKKGDEAPRGGGILERESSLASGADDGNNRSLPKHRLQERANCLEIDG